MKISVMRVLMWVILSTIALGAYTMTVGLYPRYFDIEWDEEVQLHDGRVIVVHLKDTYERLGHHFTPYSRAILRETEVSFDAGGGVGRIKQILKGGRPLILDQQNGTWFLVLSWSSHWSSQLLGGQNWGADGNPSGQHAAVLNGQKFKPISICMLPDKFQQPNFFIRYAEVWELAKFNDQRVTLEQKKEYINKYPPGYGDAYIERISTKSGIACQKPINKLQGEKQ